MLRPTKGHLVNTPKPLGNGTVSSTTPPPLLCPLLWLIMPHSLQIITAICIFPYICSCWFTNLWCGSHCQKANLRILCDKWWYLLEPAVWDRVMTKVTPNGVLWDCRCSQVGVINIDHRAPLNDRAALPLFNCCYKDGGRWRKMVVFLCLLR